MSPDLDMIATLVIVSDNSLDVFYLIELTAGFREQINTLTHVIDGSMVATHQ